MGSQGCRLARTELKVFAKRDALVVLKILENRVCVSYSNESSVGSLAQQCPRNMPKCLYLLSRATLQEIFIKFVAKAI